MNKRVRFRQLILLLCTISILTACGQKGDLYLPEGKAVMSWLG